MEENVFNINNVLKNTFHALKENCEKNELQLAFVCSKNVPREMKGDEVSLLSLLFKTFNYILENSTCTEQILALDAPKDFLYKEYVTFKITNIAFKKEHILPQLHEAVSKELDILDASLIHSKDNGGSIEISVPLVIAVLGERRHYRLPSKSILNKKILLIINSANNALSLTKMFKYFPINIDLCIKECKENRYNFIDYDLVVIEDKLFEDELKKSIIKAQKESDIKLVLYGNEDPSIKEDTEKYVSIHTDFLEKPTTQENIYQLLVSMSE